VFVSSHLMSEMALTAQRFVVIGRGRLIADLSPGDLGWLTRQGVRVRSPQAGESRDRLAGPGGNVTTGEAGVLDIEGLGSEQVGQAPRDHGAVSLDPPQVTATPAPGTPRVGRGRERRSHDHQARAGNRVGASASRPPLADAPASGQRLATPMTMMAPMARRMRVANSGICCLRSGLRGRQATVVMLKPANGDGRGPSG
jgi:hypothetical protein